MGRRRRSGYNRSPMTAPTPPSAGPRLQIDQLTKRYGARAALDGRDYVVPDDVKSLATAVLRHRPPVVITALGSPARVVEAVHSYGGLVFADVNSVAFARKAAAAGVDGLVLVAAGPLAEGISVTEHGTALYLEPVATNTAPGGVHFSPDQHCQEWTSADVAYKARIGFNAVPADSPQWPDWKAMQAWTGATSLQCNKEDMHLYCLEI